MRPSQPALRLVLLCVATAGTGLGCGNLDDITTIKDLRVLAVRADPSAFLVNLGDPASALPANLTSTLTALVVDPKGSSQELTFSGIGCPDSLDAITSATAQPAKVCPPPGTPTGLPEPYGSALATVQIASDSSMAPIVATGIEYRPVLPPFGLTPEQLGLFFSPATTGIPAVDAPVQLNRDFGIDAIVNLTFTLGAEQASALKRIVYWPDLTPTLPAAMQPEIPNQNPNIDHIEFFRARDATTGEPTEMWSLDTTPTVSIAAKDKLYVRPAPTTTWADQSEIYPLRVRNAQTMQVETQTRTELLTFDFFTTAGTFSPAERRNTLNEFQMPGTIIHLDSQLNLPKVSDLPATGQVDLWIIVHDERAGASWAHGSVTITP